MGNKYDLDYNFKYNFDSQVSLIISLTKISYSKGETVSGSMFLKTKPYLQETILYNPQADISLVEYQHSGEPDTDFDIYNDGTTNKANTSNKEKVYFTYPLDLAAYNGASLYIGITINFNVKLPDECLSSCFIDNNTFIRHFIVVNFPSIRAKKSEGIIIKNTKYYSFENKLYKSPSITKLETSKHKYAIFNMGEIKAIMTLPKNSFKYSETIYFIIEIDCSKLSIYVNGVIVSLNVKLKTNETPTGKDDSNKKSIEIISKKIPVKKGQKNYYIDDFINMPDNAYNPEFLYKKYDELKKIKFDDETFLYQSTYEEMINCSYTITAMIEINSLFSTNEYMEIPIDFYEDEISNTNNTTNNNTTNEEDELPSLEEITNLRINNNNDANKNQNKIDNNGYYNINYVDNENYINEKNNDNYESNDIDEDNSGAPPSSGEMMFNNINEK